MAFSRLKIAYLAPEIPALSATFVYKEILALEALGTEIVPFSVHKPFSGVNEPELKALKAKITYVYASSKKSVLLCHLHLVLQHPARYFRVLKLMLTDMLTLGLFNRQAIALTFRYFFAASVANDLIKVDCQHIHVHFAHVPTDIAMYAAAFAGITFSVTAHANDIFERGCLLKEKVQRAAFFATISEFNLRYLVKLGVDANKLCIVRCGVDAVQFEERKGFKANQPVKIGVVGRLVEKKGIDCLIRAIGLLKQQSQFVELLIAGNGPLRDDLYGLVKQLDLLESDVHFLGAMPHRQVAEFIKSLDIFVLPCKQNTEGDMDGIPVVLMEAMLAGVPVISTQLSGIPELVVNQETGLLVQPEGIQELADAISCLVKDDALRTRMVSKAILKVKDEFSLQGNAEIINTLFYSILTG